MPPSKISPKQPSSKQPQAPKVSLHPRNLHGNGYDMQALMTTSPALAQHIVTTKADRLSIDFANPHAVKALNSALLAHHYQIKAWDIPKGYLCPPIPGRVDYIHHLADLLAESHQGALPRGKAIRGLDIGTGANAIYPILGHACYDWDFVGSEVNQEALLSARENIRSNQLEESIAIRHQPNPNAIFDGLLSANETFTFTLCNPPFHRSAHHAAKGSLRKQQNLGQSSTTPLNFGGQQQELWCEGGELAFIRKMIEQSRSIASQVLWFTTLVSKQDNLRPIKVALKKAGVIETRVIKMGQGQKISRFIAWRYEHMKTLIQS